MLNHVRDYDAPSFANDRHHVGDDRGPRRDWRSGPWSLGRSIRTQAHARLSRVVFLIVIYPAYVVITSPAATPFLIVTINMLLNFTFSIGVGATYAFMSEAFPKSVRSSGLGILYALGVTIFGGTTQFMVAWLIDVTGSPMVPAWYQMAANVVAIVGVLLLTEHVEVAREGTVYAEAGAG